MNIKLIKFPLNREKIIQIKEEGVDPVICGPVEGTKDMYYIELPESKLCKLLAAFIQIGRKLERALRTGKIIRMYPAERKQKVG